MISPTIIVLGTVPSGPNPVSVAWSVLRSLAGVHSPGPFGAAETNHALLLPALERLSASGPEAVSSLEPVLKAYLDAMTRVNPDSLTREESLAYWINVYNAGALLLAGRAQRSGENSVLGIPGGFVEKFIAVGAEDLSLDNVEHGKVRRFKDPRVHAALVCGSVSCPHLRAEPCRGNRLSIDLDKQLRRFLDSGAARVDEARQVVNLSRIFLWFGSDFTRPHQMPTLLPAKRSNMLRAVEPWLAPDVQRWIRKVEPEVAFQPYNWSLGCKVG